MTDERRCGIVLTTVSDEERARGLARTVVERRLAACVSIVPGVRSVYRWRGSISEDGEVLLIIKTAADRFEELRATLREIHPYELPEIVLVPLGDGDPDYLRWLDASVRPEGTVR